LVVPFQCDSQQLILSLPSFRPGLARGPDSLKPQHILDMVQGDVSSSLLSAFLDFVNMVLADGVPKQLRLYFFGVNLHAQRKEDGGLIAVGLTLRRLTF